MRCARHACETYCMFECRNAFTLMTNLCIEKTYGSFLLQYETFSRHLDKHLCRYKQIHALISTEGIDRVSYCIFLIEFRFTHNNLEVCDTPIVSCFEEHFQDHERMLEFHSVRVFPFFMSVKYDLVYFERMPMKCDIPLNICHGVVGIQ